MEAVIVTLIIAGVVVLVIAAIVIAKAMERRRTEALAAVAEEMGYRFQPEVDKETLTPLSGFRLFSQGHGRRARNLMVGETTSIEMWCLDYRYTVGSGKNSSTFRQTVVAFFPRGVRLPPFALAPENFFHRIGQAFGARDIDFDEYPVFSKSYLLRGEDEDMVRHVFDDEVIRFFEENLNFNVECREEGLIFHQGHRLIKPPNLTEHILLAQRIFGLFLARSRR
ncbi:hypothetical protein JXA47_14020 [Candidatus Sumerlaeota bacterium]|nr:hypothetical protein [Candidatus Sumerlaeota bacterium]